MIKTTAILLGVMLAFGLSGCQKHGEQVPEGMVQISVDRVLETSDSTCVRLDLSFKGTHQVFLTEENSPDMARFEEDPKTNTEQGTIVLLADLINTPDNPLLKWLAQMRTEGLTVGGPMVLPVEAGTKLEDIVKITATPGDYPIGMEIELGMVNGKGLKLKVE